MKLILEIAVGVKIKDLLLLTLSYEIKNLLSFGILYTNENLTYKEMGGLWPPQYLNYNWVFPYYSLYVTKIRTGLFLIETSFPETFCITMFAGPTK